MLVKVVDDILDVVPKIVRQHKPVMQFGAPANQFAFVRVLPEATDKTANQQRLHNTHTRMGRHFKRTQLNDAEPASRAIRRVQLVDTYLGSVSIACDINQQVAQQAIYQPRFSAFTIRQSRECHFQLIEGL